MTANLANGLGVERKPRIMLAETWQIYGYGSQPYARRVSYLNDDARQAVRNDTALVVLTGCRPAQNGVSGTTNRIVIYSNGYWARVPSEEQEKQIQAFISSIEMDGEVPQ